MKEGLLKHYSWILLLCFFTFFINNRVIVPDIMESRNIITAREMVYDGHWMVPTMNGELRLEKPPLPTWITALAEKVAPDDIGLMRGMAGLAGILLVIFFYLTAEQLTHNRRYAFLSTLLLMTCYSVILMGRTASWDIYCHAFMMGAIYYLIRALSTRNAVAKEFVMAGVFMGLSFMSKGPVSFFGLLLPFLLAYNYYYRPSMKSKWKWVIIMIAICLLIGSWWYLYIYVFHPEVMSYVVHKESGSWINHNVRPWYYYWKFFLETGVWSLLLLTAIFLPVWSLKERKEKKFLMPLAWMLLSVFLLSLMPEKKSRYLLPILMPASYTMGYLIIVWEKRLKDYRRHRMDKLLYRINAWLLTAVILILPIAAYRYIYVPGYMSLAPLIILSAAVLLIAIYLGFAAMRLYPLRMVIGIVILFALAECFVMPLLKDIINNPEMKSVALTRYDEKLNGIPFYYNEKDGLRIELVYAAHRKIRPLDVQNIDSVMAALPCAIMTHKGVASELPKALWQQVDTTYIGRYDDNRRPKNNKRYSDSFIYHITLLKKKR